MGRGQCQNSKRDPPDHSQKEAANTRRRQSRPASKSPGLAQCQADPYSVFKYCEHTAHSALKGTLQGVSRRSPRRSRPQELSPTDERASLRAEYENFLIPQTPSDVISTYPIATQQRVSGGDEDADQHYVPAAQLRSPRREVLREQVPG
jgi:hypothetical protein